MLARTRRLPRTKKKKITRRKPFKPKELMTGAWFEKLVSVQAQLRAPKDCPWDREQTHDTLRPYLIEEAYEVLDALDSGNDKKFAEEMGDLLLQIVFHAQLACEEGRFTIADVIREIHNKMVRRHPHVFGTTRAKDSAEVLRNWEQIKAQERRTNARENDAKAKVEKPVSLLDGVSRGLPATLEGVQLSRKAARIGFDWNDADGIFEKMREETAELRHALGSANRQRIEEELGDLFFAAINLARFVKVDPEIALKKANNKFFRRFVEMERLAQAKGQEIANVPREEMESLWEAAKRAENNQLREDKRKAEEQR